jgi:hypothetical protein
MNNTKKPFVLSNIIQRFTNLEDEKKRKIRELKDTTTKCFVNIFFDSSEILLKFIYWVYHKINCRLMEVSCKDDEKIIFFFKGGNIMFLWRRIFETIYGPADKDIIGKTSISDCDFAIYILTKDERRYNEIYSEVKDVLIDQLEGIGEMFDELFINVVNNKRNKSNNNLNILNKKLSCEEFMANEKKIFNNFFKDFYTTVKIQKLISDIEKELKELIKNDFYEEKNYEIFRYTIPDTFNIKINKRKSLILRSEDEVPNPFSLKNFSDLKIHYVTVNANIFNNLAKAGHLVAFDLYRIKFNTIIDPIYKFTKSNPNTNNFNLQTSQTDFGIPSEFIDISVSRYYDINLQKIREEFYNNQNKKTVINNKFSEFGRKLRDGTEISSIKTMQIVYIINDLLVTLFTQNSYNPLNDPKYEKRLFRIFFFYIGNNLYHEKMIMQRDIFQILITHSDTFYSLFLSSQDNYDIKSIKNMKGKSIYNFFNILPNTIYSDLKILLQFTILFNKLLQDDTLLEEFVKYYNNIYNIIDNYDIKEFKDKFNRYKKDLDENYKKAFDYFFGIIRQNTINKIFQKKLAGGNGFENLNKNGKKSNTLNSNSLSAANTVSHKNNLENLKNLENLEYKKSNQKSNQKSNNDIYNLLFKIDDDIILDYKDISIPIKFNKREFYPSFEFDENML